MVYEDSTLSRFDAHQGLYNGKIINSRVNGIELTGYGDMLLDGVIWYSHGVGATANSLLGLRADYGCTWTGDIIIKDVDAHPYEDTDKNRYFGNNPFVTSIIYHHYSNWYYGYECHFPNVTIDNIEYYSRHSGKIVSAADMGQIEFAVRSINNGATSYSFISEKNLHLDTTANTHPNFADVDEDGDKLVDGTNIAYDSTESKNGVEDTSSYKNLNPIVPPDYIKILNNKQGYDFTSKIKYYMTKTSFFDETKIIVGSTDASGNLTVTEIITKKPEADDIITPILPY